VASSANDCLPLQATSDLIGLVVRTEIQFETLMTSNSLGLVACPLDLRV